MQNKEKSFKEPVIDNSPKKGENTLEKWGKLILNNKPSVNSNSEDFNPHVVILFIENKSLVKKFNSELEAIEKYEELVALHQNVYLAKLVKEHGEG